MERIFLILKRNWFEDIERGFKKAEYRRICPHWDKQIWSNRHNLKTVIFQLGYSKMHRLEFEIAAIYKISENQNLSIPECRQEWGYDNNIPCYVITLGDRRV